MDQSRLIGFMANYKCKEKIKKQNEDGNKEINGKLL